MRLDEVTDTDVNKMVFLFGELLKICKEELGFDKLPKIKWVSDGGFSSEFHSFGSFQPEEGIVTVSITGRHIIDMMRTLAHELVHYKQMLDGRLGPKSGETGSPIENEANAMAGVIMRKFDHKHPEAFSIKPIMEDVISNLDKLLAEGPPQITPVDAASTGAPQQVATEPNTDVEKLNELLAEHTIELGRIYGTKKLPTTKDKIYPADKGKVHKGLKVTEVIGTGKPEVYVDMDGVLADFFSDWNRMVGVGHWKEIQDPEKALDLIREHPTFWIDLKPLPNAPKLLGAVKKFAGKYDICTSPLGKDPNCEPQKRAWVQKYLSGFSPDEVHVTHNKPQFAKQADGTPNILIDDFGKNIRAWEAAGGIGIHYEDKNAGRAIQELKSAMTARPRTSGDQSKPASLPQEKSKDL